MKKIIISMLMVTVIFNIILINFSNAASVDTSQNEIPDNSQYSLTTTDVETGETTAKDFSSIISTYVTKAIKSNSTYDEVKPYIPETASTYSIIGGSDGRGTVSSTTFPYGPVGYLNMNFSDGYSNRGTAFLVAPNVALTAGHMVYDEEHGTAINGNFTPGKNSSKDNAPFGVATVRYINSPTKWAQNHDPNYDWAIILLNENIGNNCGWVGYRWYHDYSACVNMQVEITGYPKYINNGSIIQYNQFAMKGPITSATDNKLWYTIDTSGGNSGGPIWQADDCYVIGIHTSGGTTSNSGTRMNEFMYTIVVNTIKEQGWDPGLT